jgi:hypothetical protein
VIHAENFLVNLVFVGLRDKENFYGDSEHRKVLESPYL